MNSEIKPGRVENFAYDLGAKVLIKEIQRPGKVVALVIDFLGPQYKVDYWDNSKRESIFLCADELEGR